MTTRTLTSAILAITLDPALRMLFTRMDPLRFKPLWLAKLWNGLTVGKYKIKISQAVSAAGVTVPDLVQEFKVAGPRFVLDPSDLGHCILHLTGYSRGILFSFIAITGNNDFLQLLVNGFQHQVIRGNIIL